jgi:hypothetical protein
MDPLRLASTRRSKAVRRKPVNSPEVISPDAIANSECLMALEPPICPSIGTL